MTYREHITHALKVDEQFTAAEIETILGVVARHPDIQFITGGIDTVPDDSKTLLDCWERVQRIVNGGAWRDVEKRTIVPKPTRQDYENDVAEAQAAYDSNPSSKNHEDLHAAKQALNRHFPEQNGTIVPKSNGTPAESEQIVPSKPEQIVPVPCGTSRKDRLKVCEERIERGLIDIGESLEQIFREELFKEKGYPTMDIYCRTEWNMTSRRALQYRRTSEVIALLKANNCSVLPTKESHVRPLSSLSDEEIVSTWNEVIQTAPLGRITAEHVQFVVERRKPQPELNIVPLVPVATPNVVPSKVIDIAIKPGQPVELSKAAIAAVRALMDQVGTADSRQVAELSVVLQKLENVDAHLEQKHERLKRPAEVSLTTQAASRQV